MPSPAIARIRIGSVLETVTAQRVQYFVLNRFDGRREIRDKRVRISIQTDHHRVGEEFCQLVIHTPGLKDLVVDSGQKVLLETPDGFGGAQDGPLDSVRIELHQRAIALLDFNNPVLDGHGGNYTMGDPKSQTSNPLPSKSQIPAGHSIPST